MYAYIDEAACKGSRLQNEWNFVCYVRIQIFYIQNLSDGKEAKPQRTKVKYLPQNFIQFWLFSFDIEKLQLFYIFLKNIKKNS